jgi:hypothetical protein
MGFLDLANTFGRGFEADGLCDKWMPASLDSMSRTSHTSCSLGFWLISSEDGILINQTQWYVEAFIVMDGIFQNDIYICP